MIIYNYIGLFMTIIALGITLGIQTLGGIESDGPFMLIAGLLLATFDVTYRLKTQHGHIYIPNRGGSLFFLPAWLFGGVFFIAGIIEALGNQV